MGKLIIFWLRGYFKQGLVVAVYAVSLLLAVLNGFIYSDQYTRDMQEHHRYLEEYEKVYQAAQRSPEALSREGGFVGGLFKLVMPKSELKFISDNHLENIPTSRYTSVYNSSLPSSPVNPRLGSSNPVKIDLAFLVTVVFTFFTITLTFDAVSGERQCGTLKQILANSVPRFRIFITKVLAAVITVFIPLAVAVFLNLTLIVLTGAIPVDGTQIVVLAAFLALSLLLLLLFASLGVAVSSMTKSPVTSLVVLLLLWITFVNIVPGSVVIIGQTLSPVRSIEQFNKEVASAFESFLALEGGITRDPVTARDDNYKHERITNRTTRIWNIQNQNLIDDYVGELVAQAETVRGLSRVSPTAVFTLSVSRLANTDLHAVQDFYGQVNRYRGALLEALREADSRDPESSHLVYCGQRGYLSNKPFSVAPPRFSYIPEGILERISDALLDILILFSMTACVLLIGVFAFNRYDVR
jgi:ABC-type transport system involved in multi-copper enzyme maturation permease subunit